MIVEGEYCGSVIVNNNLIWIREWIVAAELTMKMIETSLANLREAELGTFCSVDFRKRGFE